VIQATERVVRNKIETTMILVFNGRKTKKRGKENDKGTRGVNAMVRHGREGRREMFSFTRYCSAPAPI
jgi:hypothetical protein